LRNRLARRGFGPERVVVSELSAACPDERLPGATPRAPTVPLCGLAWLEATVKSAEALSLGRAAMTGTVSASVLSLYEGVMQAMLINRGTTAAICLLGSSMTVAGAIVLAASGAPNTQDAAAPQSQQPSGTALPKDKPVAPVVDSDSPEVLRKTKVRRLETARLSLETQRIYYKQGRITIDRFKDASSQLMLAKIALSNTQDERVAAAKEHKERIGEILTLEQKELVVGRGTTADVAEAAAAYEDASVIYLEARQSRGSEEAGVLKKRVETLEKQIEGLKKRLENVERSGSRPRE
jgi:hypothetical protein